MKLHRKLGRRRRASGLVHASGFSTVEMVITLAVILALGAVATPILLKNLRVYQLNDSATRLADLLKLTRFEAIRNNTKTNCQFQQNGTIWTVGVASVNGTTPVTQTQLVLGGYADMLTAGAVPDPSPIAASLGGGGTLALSTVSGANGFIRFDARGAVDFAGAPWSVQVFYLGSAADSASGYRAVADRKSTRLNSSH